jgi:phage terminase large subunit GpA-like protein
VSAAIQSVQGSTVFLSAPTLAAFQRAAVPLKPPPKMTLTEWAEQNIVLSSDDSAFGGQPYRARIAPYQRGMQDACLEPGVRRVVFWTSSQVGKTQIIKNVIAYFMREDACSILFMLPTEKMAEKVSLQRIAPMLRDCPSLAGLVNEGGRRRGNSTLTKTFPGGMLFMVGTNSPSALSSMPIRLVLGDEVDRFERSAGDEGDPISLGEKRQTTFWNALTVLSSTCTIKGDSPIEGAYGESDRAKFWVPCPHCGEFQVLKWKRLTFPKDEEPTIANTVYACDGCGVALTEFDKPHMIERGEWRSERPEVRDVRGFWINEMYSPFSKWFEMARKWRQAMRHREEPQQLKVFVNTSLAETYEEASEKIDGDELMMRREEYPPPALPDGVTVITCGVDVQEDRLELEVVGHGKGEETWSIEYLRFEGNTSRIESGKRGDGSVDPLELSPWERLEKFLSETRYLHERGIRLPIASSLVDSGDQTQTVYEFTKRMQQLGLRCFASKGVAGWGRAPVSNWNKNNKPRVKLYPIGVDILKKLVYDRLKLLEPGAGYMHFSKIHNGAEYFKQLTAEKIVKSYVRGFPVKRWELQTAGTRNEVLDCRVLAVAAFHTLSTNPAKMLEALRADLLHRAKLAAADRRAHVPVGQLSLLALEEQVPEETAADPARDDQGDPVRTSAETPAEPATAREFAEKIVDQALGARERQTAPPVEKPAPAKRIRIRRGGWL